jgi:hypothetical protein
VGHWEGNLPPPSFFLAKAKIRLGWRCGKCYLEAWTYASSFSKGLEAREEEDADDGALRKEFIPNWTSPEFEAFVGKIGSFVDVLSEQEGEGKVRVVQRMEELWRRVLDVEERFWPKIDAWAGQGKERGAQGLQQLEGGQILWTGSVKHDCPVFMLFKVEIQVEY